MNYDKVKHSNNPQKPHSVNDCVVLQFQNISDW